ncbi:MAG: aspartate/glutamate racemase family protein [Pseudomonadota bacterium]
MQIGLIGGIGPAATDYYYQSLIAQFADKKIPLDLTIVHADSPTLLSNLAANDIDSQVSIYHRLTERLAKAGAECVVVTSIGGHFCIDAFKQVSPLPVIDMLEAVAKAVADKAMSRVGILGTKTVMETKFYSGLGSIEVVPPEGEALGDVHDAYVTMASAGSVSQGQRSIFDAACKWMIQQKEVEAILLGGTDLALVYRQGETDFPIVDCAAIHVDAIVGYAV